MPTTTSATTTTIKELSFVDALDHVEAGAAFVDIRKVRDYLDVHIPGSIGNLHESGPGFAGRMRDCIPLEVPFVLMDAAEGPAPVDVAAALRGKGFTVLGYVEDALNAWARNKGTPVSTEVIEGNEAGGKMLLDVGDPGATHVEGALRITSDRLWSRVDEVVEAADGGRVVVVAGYGVRAALCVGILERHGISEITYWKP
ncbi:MAG: hypothetical protein GEU71_07640 [Actinobacteria bacterium]|nr:hypothetical protein [Actinomycetota bacterium]